jgi:sugar phosphate isomerase/epimerase
MTRREFGGTIGGLMLRGAAMGSQDVAIGCGTISFIDRPFDEAILAMKETGFTRCEVYLKHLEPDVPREELRKWRTTVDLSHFEKARKKLDAAGIQLDSYYYGLWGNTSEEEIARAFEMAKALGVSRISASSVLSMAARIDAYASRAKIRVGLHNHSIMRPDQLATPQSFEQALTGRSEYMNITLDMGHLAACGFDAVAFIEKWHTRILGVHLKDRKKDNGPDVPFGQGDAPIRQVLHLLSGRGYAIPTYIEYERKEPDTLAAVRASLEYCRAALAGSSGAHSTGRSGSERTKG